MIVDGHMYGMLVLKAGMIPLLLVVSASISTPCEGLQGMVAQACNCKLGVDTMNQVIYSNCIPTHSSKYKID